MLISHTVLVHRGLSPNVKKVDITLLDIYVPNDKASKYMTNTDRITRRNE